MSGKVIQALRISPLATFLSEAELRSLSGCGRLDHFVPGQTILEANGLDERLFILAHGQATVRLLMMPETDPCGGEATYVVSSPGEPFGWAAWMRQDRLVVSASAQEPTSLVALDLQKLGDTQTFLKISQRMLQVLYGRLQEYGICPPNIRALLKMKHLFLGEDLYEHGMG